MATIAPVPTAASVVSSMIGSGIGTTDALVVVDVVVVVVVVVEVVVVVVVVVMISKVFLNFPTWLLISTAVFTFFAKSNMFKMV